MFKRLIVVCLVSLLSLFTTNAGAQDIAFHDVLQLDSINLFPANIRINQFGYLPNDPGKRAFVTAYRDFQPQHGAPFYIIADGTGEIVYEGTLEDSGYEFARGSFRIMAYMNSITPWSPPYPLIANHGTERFFFANFGDFEREGRFRIVANGDTSWTFRIDRYLYNELLDMQLKYLAFQRCGVASWAKGPCHTYDGEYVGAPGALIGGWHDCGDHVKFSLTKGFTASVLGILAATFEDYLNDRYNAPMTDTIFTDGIPDLIYELYFISQYYLRLYDLSREHGIYPEQLYHVVGAGRYDHQWWGRPEWQDAVPQRYGGRPRPVGANAGSEVAAKMGATLAFFATVWEQYDPVMAQRALDASICLYHNYVVRHLQSAFNGVDRTGSDFRGFYRSNLDLWDEVAAHLVALLYATRDPVYRYDLLENTAYGYSGREYVYNANLFRAGWFAHRRSVPFHPGGWPQDWENMHAFVLFAFKTLIIPDVETAALYGFTEEEYHNYSIRTAHAFIKNLEAGNLINNANSAAAGLNVKIPPYNIPNFTMAWGFNRYNLGMSVAGQLFMEAFRGRTFNVGPDLAISNEYRYRTTANFDDWEFLVPHAQRHLDYLMGMNPWDISFVMGAGTKHLNHPHSRTASPELLNNAAQIYGYTMPIGALMGGVDPEITTILREEADNFIISETCIDYSMVLMAMTVANSRRLPPDTLPPGIVRISWHQVDTATMLINWQTNELSRDTLYLSTNREYLQNFLNGTAPFNSSIITILIPDSSVDAISNFQFNNSLLARNLRMETVYYFAIKSTDVRRNWVYHDNEGDLYSFIIEDINITISNVHVCNITPFSARIQWNTNHAAPSMVVYGRISGNYTDTVYFGDDAMVSYFHRVTLRNLTPETRYFFRTISAGVVSEEGSFVTTFDFARIEVSSALRTDGNIWVNINNRDNERGFAGLEVRFYIDESAGGPGQWTYWGVNPRHNWRRTDVAGPQMLNPTSTLRTDANGHRYISMQMAATDTLDPVGRWKFQIDIVQWENFSIDGIRNSWSARAHAGDGQFPEYRGIGATVGDPDNQLVRQPPDPWAGMPVMIENPYIVVFHNNRHIYGYYPGYNFAEGPLIQDYEVVVDITSPFNSLFSQGTIVRGQTPQREIEVRGRVSAIGDMGGRARIGRILVNGTIPAQFDPLNDGNDVEFWFTTTLQAGVNTFDVVAFADARGGECHSGSRSFHIDYRRGVATRSQLTVFDESFRELSRTPAGIYMALVGSNELFFGVNDSDQSAGSAVTERVQILVYSQTTNDSVWITLPESGLNTGYFTNTGIHEAGIVLSTETSANLNNVLTVATRDTVVARYIDRNDNSDVSIQLIYVAEDIPTVEFVNINATPMTRARVNVDSVFVRVRDRSSWEAGVNEITAIITSTNGIDTEQITLVRDPDRESIYLSPSSFRVRYGISASEVTHNNGIISVNMPTDTLRVVYVSASSGESVEARLPVVIPRTASGLYVYDANSRITDRAFLGEEILFFVVEDLDESKNPNVVDSIPVTIVSPSTNDTELIWLRETDVHSGIFDSRPERYKGINVVVGPEYRVNDGNISCFDGDTIIVRYIDPDDSIDVSVRRIFVGTNFPRLSFTNRDYAPVTFYIRNFDHIYMSLRDSATWHISDSPDSIIVTVASRSGFDSAQVVLVRSSQPNFFHSQSQIPIVFGTAETAISTDNIMSVALRDSIFAYYTSDVTGEEVFTIVAVISPDQSTIMDNLKYHVAPNPLLISDLESGRSAIRISLFDFEEGTVDTTIRLVPEEFDSLRIESIQAVVYDLRGNIVKRFNRFTPPHGDPSEPQIVEFTTPWDGRNRWGNFVSTGVYIVRFELEFMRQDIKIKRYAVVDVYIINDKNAR